MRATELSYRGAGPGDQVLLTRLIAAYYAYDHIAFDAQAVADGLARLLADESVGRAYLLELGEVLAGYVILTFGFDIEFGGRLATITDLYLEPPYRRRGLGSEVLSFVSRECRALGAKAIELQVEEDNLPAQALYKKLGFVQLSRLPMSKPL